MRVVQLAFAPVALLVACSSSGSGSDPSSSVECQEFCDKVASQCPGQSCTSKSCAAHDVDPCPAATLARLKCEAEKGTWACFSGGWAVAYSCDTEMKAACGLIDAGVDSA